MGPSTNPAVPPPGASDFTRWEWAALLIVVCCGFSSQMVMPLWVGAVIDSLGLSPAAAGRIGSLEFMAVAIVSLAVALLVARLPTRPTATAGIVLLILGNCASAYAAGEPALIAARVVCGIGKGLVVAIVFGLAAGSPRPTRAFALLNIVYALFSTVFYLIVPLAIRSGGASGAFLCMAAVGTIGAVMLVRFPTQRLPDSELTGLRLADIPRSGLLAFAALMILWAGNNIVWTFVERIGVRDGLDVTAIGGVLSAAAFLTIAGPTIARLVDTRFGYVLPLSSAILLAIAATMALGHVARPAVFIATVPAFMLLFLFITPYVMGILSLADPAGRLAAASSAAMTAGGSAGASIGGAVMQAGGIPALAWAASALFLLFLALILSVAPRGAGRIGAVS